jgi:hypothetical protein
MIETPDISALEPSADDWKARRDRLLNELRAPAAARRRRRRIPRVAIVVLAVAGTAAGGVAAAGLLRADDVVPHSIACLKTPTQDVETATFVPTRPDPVAACAELWPGTAPPLVACAGKGELVRVVPADSDAVCARLGLSPLPPEFDAIGRSQADARAVADRVMTARGSCPATLAPLMESMRAALAAAGLHDWRVVAGHEKLLQFCRADIDARTRTIAVFHADPVTRIYAHVRGEELGSYTETVIVKYEGRSDCPAAAPLARSLRAKLGDWRVRSAAQAESCSAEVDGHTRTVTLR